MRSTRLAALVTGLTLLGAPLAASAEGLPLQFSERPLTLTEGTLTVDAYLSYFKIADIDLGIGTLEVDPIISLIAGVDYGVTDDLEVGVVAVPLVLSPDTEYGNPYLHARYRFLKTAVEVAGHVGITVPVQDGSDFGLDLGVPVLFGLTNTTRLTSGVFLGLEFGDETATALGIPLELAVNLSPQFFIFAKSGIYLPDFDLDFLYMPLGIGAGYTLAAGPNKPLADIYAGFTFANFINGSGDTISTDISELRLGALVHFD